MCLCRPPRCPVYHASSEVLCSVRCRGDPPGFCPSDDCLRRAAVPRLQAPRRQPLRGAVLRQSVTPTSQQTQRGPPAAFHEEILRSRPPQPIQQGHRGKDSMPFTRTLHMFFKYISKSCPLFSTDASFHLHALWIYIPPLTRKSGSGSRVGDA